MDLKVNDSILTRQQIDFLDTFSDSDFVEEFVLSGGTALTGFYIPYRISDDLDFFSMNEVDVNALLVFLKSMKDKLKYKSLDIKTSFNRNLVFLEFEGNYVLKLEFTYYPFTKVASTNEYENIQIDSLEDIATNKLFTIYQNPRYRDFTDLRVIFDELDLDLEKLIIKAKTKFDWHVDRLQLGKQFYKVKNRVDVPRLLGDFDQEKCEKFFLDLSKQLSNSIK